MIQRKQTLHLLAIVALMVAMLFMPLATMTFAAKSTDQQAVMTIDGSQSLTQSEVRLDVWGIYYDGQKDVSTTYLLVLVILTTVVAAVNIFLFKHRWLQLRLCFVLAIMQVGLIAFIVMYLLKLNSAAATDLTAAIRYSIVDLFPLFALFFTWMAYRGVVKDIALIRSLDRIR